MTRADEVTVLIVDDDPDITLFLSSVLGDAGIRTEIAHDGREALERLRAHRPDLISLDLVMPGHSGIRLLHDLRKHPEWSRIPVIVVSGHVREDSVQRDLNQVLADSTISGPSLYLEKPVTARGYLEAVERVLGLTPAARPSTADRAEALRHELEELIEGADADALEDAAERLRLALRTPTRR